jgi:hypothetical protein
MVGRVRLIFFFWMGLFFFYTEVWPGWLAGWQAGLGILGVCR